MNTFIRQAGRHREKYKYIQRDTKFNITKHIVIEMAQQITNSFMQWNKNSPHALITVNNN